jgi:phage-related protein
LRYIGEGRHERAKLRMPRTKVVFFLEHDESVPIVYWLDGLISKAQIKCLAKLKRLEDLGHELRRPEADYLRDGIYELRVGLERVNYRILYFFHGKAEVVISHGITKEREVPPKEIDLAARRRARFEASPKKHRFEPEN